MTTLTRYVLTLESPMRRVVLRERIDAVYSREWAEYLREKLSAQVQSPDRIVIIEERS